MSEEFHIKLEHNGEIFRFTAIRFHDELLEQLRKHVSAIVKSSVYQLCWRGDESGHVLDSSADFLTAIEYVRAAVASPAEPPCVHISVADVGSESEQEVTDSLAAIKLDNTESTMEAAQRFLTSLLKHHDSEVDRAVTAMKSLGKDSLRPYCSLACKARNNNKIELTFSTDSPLHLSMWTVCLTTACAKFHNIHCSTAPNSVTLSMNSIRADDLLEYLKPLAHCTHFDAVDLSEVPPHMITTLFTNFPRATNEKQPLQPLLDSVLRIQKCKRRQLESQCAELKMSADKMFYRIGGLTVSPSESGIVGQFDVQPYGICDRLGKIWELCVQVAINALRMREWQHKFMSFRADITVNASDAGPILKFLRPIFEIPEFKTVAFRGDVSPPIMAATTAQLAGLTVDYAEFAQEDTISPHFGAWLDAVRTLQPSVVQCGNLLPRQESTNFLVQLADLVDGVSYWDSSMLPESPVVQTMSLSTIREIFARKCRYVEILSSGNELSVVQAEQMIQHFHNLGKRAALRMSFDSSSVPMIVQIGEYNAKIYTSHHDENIILIEHVEIEPKLSDRFRPRYG